MPYFAPAIPILRVDDEAETRAFYLDYLGFEIEFEHRFADDMPLYLGVIMGELKLHLSEHTGDAAPHARVFIPMHGVEDYRDALIARDPALALRLDHREWGTEFTVTDPFGNRLTFCEMAG